MRFLSSSFFGFRCFLFAAVFFVALERLLECPQGDARGDNQGNNDHHRQQKPFSSRHNFSSNTRMANQLPQPVQRVTLSRTTTFRRIIPGSFPLSSTPPPPLLIDEEDTLLPSRGVVIFFLAMFIATVSLIVVVLIWDRSPMAGLFLGLAFWTWLLAAAIVAFGPLTLAWRLRRTRSRRHQLMKSEWMIGEEDPQDRET